jgi:hypothetical protein
MRRTITVVSQIVAWLFIILAVPTDIYLIILATQGSGYIGGNLGWLVTLALNPFNWGAIPGAIYLLRRRRLSSGLTS